MRKLPGILTSFCCLSDNLVFIPCRRLYRSSDSTQRCSPCLVLASLNTLRQPSILHPVHMSDTKQVQKGSKVEHQSPGKDQHSLGKHHGPAKSPFHDHETNGIANGSEHPRTERSHPHSPVTSLRASPVNDNHRFNSEKSRYGTRHPTAKRRQQQDWCCAPCRGTQNSYDRCHWQPRSFQSSSYKRCIQVVWI